MTFDDEKYKELIYDLQRANTDEDSHELIVNYVDPSSGKYNIRCIKDVIMDGSGDREFTKGRTYLLKMNLSSFNATNDSGTYHGLDMDGWFQKHFEFI